MSDSKATAFGKHFIANFAPEILNSYLHHIDLYMNRKIWLSERCVYLIIDFLEDWYVQIIIWLRVALSLNSLGICWTIIFLISSNTSCFHCCVLHKMIWNFGKRIQGSISIRKLVQNFSLRLMQDVYDEYLYPDIAASRFLTQLASKRQKSCFTIILQFINTTLSLYNPPILDAHI